MNRRPRLPGADELFRSTGTGPRAALAEATLTPVEAPDETREVRRGGPSANAANSADDSWQIDAATTARPVRIARRSADARPTGRERHDEKITVYCSPEELLQIEHARLTLRGSHGVAVDRGRIVREAVAVVLADLEAKGDASILVRRLRGR
jgi:hypothetical protein